MVVTLHAIATCGTNAGFASSMGIVGGERGSGWLVSGRAEASRAGAWWQVGVLAAAVSSQC